MSVCMKREIESAATVVLRGAPEPLQSTYRCEIAIAYGLRGRRRIVTKPVVISCGQRGAIRFTRPVETAIVCHEPVTHLSLLGAGGWRNSLDVKRGGGGGRGSMNDLRIDLGIGLNDGHPAHDPWLRRDGASL